MLGARFIKVSRMENKAKRVNRLKFWSGNEEIKIFHAIRSIVPKTVFGMLDSVKHKGDIRRFCDKKFKTQDAMCDMMVRIHRTFDGEWSTDDEK